MERSMTHRLLHLPPDIHDFVQSRIESGSYETPGQLVQAAFSALHREESDSSNRPAESSIAEDDAFRKLWEVSPQLPADRRKLPRQD
jgi:Arc/MetJ-type ribon-helix-helix transcriptional regulator